MSKQADYSNVLKEIKEFYQENAIEAVCPTLKSPLRFKPLNVRQLKSFMALQVNYEGDELGMTQGLNVVKELCNVLKENCLDTDIDTLNTLTVLDRDILILQLRAHTNPIAEVQQGEDEVIKVDLADVIARIKKSIQAPMPSTATKTLEYNNSKMILNLEAPTLYKDNLINDYFASNVKSIVKTKADFEKHSGDIFTQVYFIELFKYISSIEFDKGGNRTKVDFGSKKTFAQNIELLESLPTQVVTEITSFVTDIKAYRDTLLCYVDNNGKTVPLDIDANIFIGI